MKRFLLLIIPLLAISCGNGGKAGDEPKVIPFGDGQTFEAIQKHVSEVSYLPLETNDSSRFSSAGKVLFRDGMIYVGDYTLGKICVFDSTGGCRMVLDSVSGPDTMWSFTVDDTWIDVMDLMRLKLNRYDKESGELAESLDLPVFAFDIEALGNGDFLFCCMPMGGRPPIQQSAHRIFITDPDLNIKEEMIEYSVFTQDLIHPRPLLTVSDDRISMFSFQEDGYYVFDRKDGHLLEKVQIAFSNPIPEQLKGDGVSLSGGYSFIVSSPYLLGDWTSFMAKVGEGGGLYEYDFANGTLFSISTQEKGTYLYNIVGTLDGAFVGLISHWSANYDLLVENGFQKADSASEAAIRRDDPVLIFYKVKP